MLCCAGVSLKKIINKGTKEEKAVYYHHVLEVKLIPGDGFVVSMGSEFIDFIYV